MKPVFRERLHGSEAQAKAQAALKASNLETRYRRQIDRPACVSHKQARAVVCREHVASIESNVDAFCGSGLGHRCDVHFLSASWNADRRGKLLADMDEGRPG